MKWLFAILVTGFGFVFLLAEGDAEIQAQKLPPALPEVSFMHVNAATHEGVIAVYGIARSEHEVTVLAEVAGNVKDIHSSLRTGNQVLPEQSLVYIDDLRYRHELASATQRLADSEVLYQQETQNAELAETEWFAAGLTESPSDLTLRKPQLKSAAAAMAETRLAVDIAVENLSKTQVKAPFAGLIQQRFVAPGAFVQSGAELFQIFSTNQLEVSVYLTESQWREINLGPGDTVMLKDPQSGVTWQARIARMSGIVHGETRQRALVATVANPLLQTPALYPGTFVEMQIPKRDMLQAFRLPPSALSDQGYIWFVNENNQLDRYLPESVLIEERGVLVSAPAGQASIKVLTKPLSVYKPGLAVLPLEVLVEVELEVDA